MGKPPSEVLWIATLLGVCSALEWVRIGSFQLEDLLLLFVLALSMAKFIYSLCRVRLPKNVRPLLTQYGGLLALLLACSVLSLRLPFYPLDEPTFLQKPLLFSLARLLQFTATVSGFLWLVTCFHRKPTVLLPVLNWYYRAGVCSSVWGLGWYAAVRLLHLTPDKDSVVGVIQQFEGLRVRGFFNEGGPFGIYLVSVVLTGMLRKHLIGRRLGVFNLLLIGVAFLLSQSLAAVVVVVVLLSLWLATNTTFRQKIGYGALIAVCLAGATVVLDLPAKIVSYMVSFQTVDQQVDPEAATGRVSAVYIVPRMIAAHPLTGIGLGNYPFMRNDPLYRGPLPVVTFSNDMPALGIPGTAAEIGIPATLWLVLLTLVPYFRARKQAAAVVITAAFQPVAHALGAQFTLFYPWFVSACALAVADHKPFWAARVAARKPARNHPRVQPCVPVLAMDTPE